MKILIKLKIFFYWVFEAHSIMCEWTMIFLLKFFYFFKLKLPAMVTIFTAWPSVQILIHCLGGNWLLENVKCHFILLKFFKLISFCKVLYHNMNIQTSYKSFSGVIKNIYFFQIEISNDANNMRCMITCVNAILIPCCCTTLSKFQLSLQNWDSSKTFSLFLILKYCLTQLTNGCLKQNKETADTKAETQSKT